MCGRFNNIILVSLCIICSCSNAVNPFLDPSRVELSLTLMGKPDDAIWSNGDTIRIGVLLYLPYLVDSVTTVPHGLTVLESSWVPVRDNNDIYDSNTITVVCDSVCTASVIVTAWVHGGTTRIDSLQFVVIQKPETIRPVRIEVTIPPLTRDSAVVDHTTATVSGIVLSGYGALRSMYGSINHRDVSITLFDSTWHLDASSMNESAWNTISITATDMHDDTISLLFWLYRMKTLDKPLIPSVHERLCAGLVIQWRSLAGSSNYLVWRQVHSEDAILVADSPDTLFEDSELASGTAYSYYIQSRYSVSTGSFTVSDTSETSPWIQAKTALCWQAVYDTPGHDHINSIVAAQNGNWIVTGSVGGATSDSMDLFLAEIDSSGFVAWTRRYGTPREESGSSVVPMWGGYAVAGLTTRYGAGDRDIWLLYTTSNGDTLRTFTYGNTGRDCALSAAVIGHENILIGGYLGTAGNIRRPYVMNIQQQGTVVWDIELHLGEGQVSAVAPMHDGRAAIAGFAHAFTFTKQPGRAFLGCLGPEGDSLWTITYFAGEKSWFNHVVQTDQGDLIVSGCEMTSYPGDCSILLARVTGTGDIVWSRAYRNVLSMYANRHVVNTRGQIAIAGYQTSSYGTTGEDALLMLCAPSGDTLWSVAYGDSGNDRFHSIALTPDGGYLMVGRTESFGVTGEACYFVKTDARGTTGPLK